MSQEDREKYGDKNKPQKSSGGCGQSSEGKADDNADAEENSEYSGASTKEIQTLEEEVTDSGSTREFLFLGPTGKKRRMCRTRMASGDSGSNSSPPCLGEVPTSINRCGRMEQVAEVGSRFEQPLNLITDMRSERGPSKRNIEEELVATSGNPAYSLSSPMSALSVSGASQLASSYSCGSSNNSSDNIDLNLMLKSRTSLLVGSFVDQGGTPSVITSTSVTSEVKCSQNTASVTNESSSSDSSVFLKKKLKCPDCGKEFSQLRNYRYHRSRHEGTNQFACTCPVCGKSFNDKGYLSSHLKIHKNAKEYKCDWCDKSFNQRVAYNMHIRIHTGHKPHQCNLCLKAFSRKMLLRQHLRTHTGERPYSCEVCGKAFADRSNMLLHQRLHSGQRPFSCDVCGKSFSKNHHLKTHLNHHAGIKPYKCDKCQATFSQSSNMKTHFRKCTGSASSAATTETTTMIDPTSSLTILSPSLLPPLHHHVPITSNSPYPLPIDKYSSFSSDPHHHSGGYSSLPPVFPTVYSSSTTPSNTVTCSVLIDPSNVFADSMPINLSPSLTTTMVREPCQQPNRSSSSPNSFLPFIPTVGKQKRRESVIRTSSAVPQLLVPTPSSSSTPYQSAMDSQLSSSIAHHRINALQSPSFTAIYPPSTSSLGTSTFSCSTTAHSLFQGTKREDNESPCSPQQIYKPILTLPPLLPTSWRPHFSSSSPPRTSYFSQQQLLSPHVSTTPSFSHTITTSSIHSSNPFVDHMNINLSPSQTPARETFQQPDNSSSISLDLGDFVSSSRAFIPTDSMSTTVVKTKRRKSVITSSPATQLLPATQTSTIAVGSHDARADPRTWRRQFQLSEEGEKRAERSSDGNIRHSSLSYVRTKTDTPSIPVANVEAENTCNVKIVSTTTTTGHL